MSRIQGLERYITDDVIRHGNRLSELEKKITNVYQELTSSEAIDDDALFANEDDEEEESAFVMYALCLLALAGTDADMVIFAQGSIHRRHWRGLSWSARAWYRCRTRPFLSLDSKASPQRQEECQRPECCVWSLFSPATPCPKALFSSIAQSPPNPHRRIPRHRRSSHLPWEASRAKLACFVVTTSTASQVRYSIHYRTTRQILRRRNSARSDR